MKTCTRCLQQKPTDSFYKKASGKDGLFAHCKICHSHLTNSRFAKRRSTDKDFVASENSRSLEWSRANKERRSEYSKQYTASNLAKLAAKTARHRSDKLKRTPKWLDAVDNFELECIYTYCGALRKAGLHYEVDHEVPLHGKFVSGLHVPSNLRVIRMLDNRTKSNKF